MSESTAAGSSAPVGPASTLSSNAGSVAGGQMSPTCKTVGDYNLTTVLGEGTFAKVFRGVNKKTGKEYAVKCMAKNELVRHKKGKEQLVRELKALGSLRGHKNIVELKEILQTSSSIYIVMEVVDGGELVKQIPPGKGMPEEEARGYFTQMINAVQYCHGNKIAHRDIKPENLILTADGLLKITDFGLSNLQEVNEGGSVSRTLHLQTVCGTPHYVAPEVIRDDGGYNGFQADVWSCGVVLYAMLVGGLPFKGRNTSEVLDRIRRSDPDPCAHLSPGAQGLLSRLLEKDPAQRITVSGVLADPWFTAGSGGGGGGGGEE